QPLDVRFREVSLRSARVPVFSVVGRAAAPNGIARFTVRASCALDHDVELSFAAADEAAVGRLDLAAGTLRLPAGEREGVVEVLLPLREPAKAHLRLDLGAPADSGVVIWQAKHDGGTRP